MKIPNFKRINKGDFPKDYEQLVELLAGIVNTAFDAIYSVFNKNITLADNINCQVKEVDVAVDANGDPLAITGFTHNLKAKPEGITVIQAINLTNPNIYPTAGVNISYSINNSRIEFDNVAGLPANNTFRLKVVLFG